MQHPKRSSAAPRWSGGPAARFGNGRASADAHDEQPDRYTGRYPVNRGVLVTRLYAMALRCGFGTDQFAETAVATLAACVEDAGRLTTPAEPAAARRYTLIPSLAGGDHDHYPAPPRRVNRRRTVRLG
jgi:hypothetical protein